MDSLAVLQRDWLENQGITLGGVELYLEEMPLESSISQTVESQMEVRNVHYMTTVSEHPYLQNLIDLRNENSLSVQNEIMEGLQKSFPIQNLEPQTSFPVVEIAPLEAHHQMHCSRPLKGYSMGSKKIMASHFVQQMQQQPQVIAIRGFSIMRFLSNIGIGTLISRPKMVITAPFKILGFVGRKLDLLPPQIQQNKYMFFIGELEKLKMNNFIRERLVEGSVVMVLSPTLLIIIKKVGDILIICCLIFGMYKLVTKFYKKSLYKKKDDEIRRLREEIRHLKNIRY